VSTAGDSLRGPLRIVAIGGGTGLSTILRGLKPYTAPPNPRISITAIVTVTDDGGSSGRLRREMAVLPPGDIRNCLVALSEDEALLSRMFQYRFSSGRGLKGHNFGNLFLTVLTELTGDFAHAVRLASEVLASRGDVIPSTAENVVLEAQLTGNKLVKGESNISKSRERIEWIHILPRSPQPFAESIEAIRSADLITLGPGSLYTSVIPNLLVRGIPREIMRSPGIRTYVSNLMGQPGETTGLTASGHVEAVVRHAGLSAAKAAKLLDFVVVNTAPLAERALKRYAAQRSKPVEVDEDRLAQMKLRVIGETLFEAGSKIRHDPARTAGVLLRLARLGRRRRQIAASASAPE